MDHADLDAPVMPLRRRVLAAGLGGAAVSLLPRLAGRAGATTPPPDAPATTTTAPPLQPTDADITLLVFAESVEIAARDLYDIALGSVQFDDVQRAVVTSIRDAHAAYYHALSGMLGRRGSAVANAEVIDALASDFRGNADSVLEAMYGLESTAVATHTDLLAELEGTDGAKLIASILVVEARHGTVLASLRGDTSLDDLLVADEAEPLVAG